jgi:hypothetical protein
MLIDYAHVLYMSKFRKGTSISAEWKRKSHRKYADLERAEKICHLVDRPSNKR